MGLNHRSVVSCDRDEHFFQTLIINRIFCATQGLWISAVDHKPGGESGPVEFGRIQMSCFFMRPEPERKGSGVQHNNQKRHSFKVHNPNNIQRCFNVELLKQISPAVTDGLRENTQSVDISSQYGLGGA